MSQRFNSDKEFPQRAVTLNNIPPWYFMMIKKLSQLSLLTKLLSGFSILIILMLLLGSAALYQLHLNNQNIESYRDSRLPGVRYTLEMRGTLSEIRLQQIQYIASVTDKEREGHRVELLEDTAIFQRALDSYTKLLTDSGQKPLLDPIIEGFGKFSAVNQDVINAVSKGQLEEASRISGAVSSQYRGQLMKDLAKLVDLEIEKGNAAAREASKGYQDAKYTLLGMLLLAVVMSCALALVISRSISRQLGGEPRYAMEIMNEISTGNLLTAIALRPGDNHSLLAAISHMNQRLADTVRNIIDGSESITMASNEIAQGNSDLSQRTEEQAASLLQTSSNMQQLTQTVRQNADNAREASSLAQKTSDTASQGGEIVNDMLARMQEISHSSQKIVNIIAVIEGIAFQTNILALNAAVEAARAGSEGKGFAVVAGEVRTLAQKSADAAKEIKALIEGTVEKITEGSQQADKAGKAMTDVVDSVNQVSKIVADISMASDEQHIGIKEISVAIDQMDQVTQQNAALVEESATAAESLTEQGEQLRNAVRFFRVEQASALRLR